MKMWTGIFVITSCFLAVTVSANHTELHLDFNVGSIADYGFFINAEAPESVIEINKDATYLGNGGLKFFSDPIDTQPNSIARPIGMSLDSVAYLSYAVYTTEHKPVIRLRIVDDTGTQSFDLDLMRNSVFDWQSNGGFYYFNFDIHVDINQWVVFSFELKTIIANALLLANSPFTEFTPSTIEFMEIYQDTAQTGGENIENCIDEITFSSTGDGVGVSSNPGSCYTPPTSSQRSTTTNENNTPNSGPTLPVPYQNQWVVIVPTLAILSQKKRNQ